MIQRYVLWSGDYFQLVNYKKGYCHITMFYLQYSNITRMSKM